MSPQCHCEELYLSDAEISGISKPRLLRPLSGPRNDDRRCHCEAGRFCLDVAISGTEGVLGNAKRDCFETQKRDCHGPLRGPRNDASGSPYIPTMSLRGRASFVPPRRFQTPKAYWKRQKRGCFGSQGEPRNDASEKYGGLTLGDCHGTTRQTPRNDGSGEHESRFSEIATPACAGSQ